MGKIARYFHKPTAKVDVKKPKDKNLESLMSLGANEDDLTILEGIVDDDEELLEVEDSDSDAAIGKELADFIDKLGLNKMAALVDDEDDTPGDDEGSLKLSENAKVKPTAKQKVKPPSKEVKTKSSKQVNVASYKQEALSYLEEEINHYKTAQSAKKGSDWMGTVLKSGTAKDRTAALALLVQENPQCNMHCLDNLLNMVGKKGRREALMGLDVLTGLWLNHLLPDHKLTSFTDRPLSDLTPGSRRSTLLSWLHEDQLKERYGRFLAHLQDLLKDPVVAPKRQALYTVYQLLVAKPEQEKALLTMIINKLGDPEGALSAQACKHLHKLLQNHPQMKSAIVLEVEMFLFRQNLQERAQYNGICFLNQTILSPEEEDVALKLIDIYFSIFKGLTTNKKKSPDPKMLSALLTGVNRAYPYAKSKVKVLDDQVDSLFRLVHTTDFDTAVHSLMLLYKITEHSGALTDRYYQALYRKLLDPQLRLYSKQALFLNLIMQSVKKDQVMCRIKALCKRLLQVCLHIQAPTFVTAVLMTLSHVVHHNPGVLKVDSVASLAPEGGDDEEEERFEDIVDMEGEGQEEVRDKVQSTASWVHRQNIQNTGASSSKGKSVESYDPTCRNPLHCHADNECLYELQELQQHYHPSVAMFVDQLLKGEMIDYEGDPLDDFTLIRFLDRFVYRNPKKLDKGPQTVLARRHHGPVGARGVPVNTTQYARLPETKIPADERFFYQYFRERTVAKKGDDESDYDSDDLDEYLDEIEKDVDFDEDLDFGSHLHKKVKTGEDEDDEDSDLDLATDDDDDLTDGIEDDEDIDDDEEEELLSDDDEDLEDFDEPVRKKKKGNEMDDLFMSAEEFSQLLDVENVKDLKYTSKLSNKDSADVKQLKWELDREWKDRKRNHQRKNGQNYKKKTPVKTKKQHGKHRAK